jgi:hypothetical protein
MRLFQKCNYKIQSNHCTTANLGTQKKWPLYRGGCSVEGFQSKLVSKLAWPEFAWPLLTGGRYSDVAVNTGLTVQSNYCTMATLGTQKSGRCSKVVVIERLILKNYYQY